MIRHVTRMTMMNMTTQSNKHPSCEIIPSRAIYMFNLRINVFFIPNIIKGDYDSK